MKKPISYLQTDGRWANVDYSAEGEKTTIGKSGCGPSCMAMVIATLKDKTVTPKETCAWALKHGYKAPEQGTYYSYFEPQGEEYGIEVKKLNPSNLRNVSNAQAYHEKALKAVKDGDWVICCMGPIAKNKRGNWTSSGHFILWYGVDGNNVIINDPNSTAPARLRAKLSLLQSEAKYYFVVTVPDHKDETARLAAKISGIITVDDKTKLAEQLNDCYDGSMYWVIQKLLACDFKGKTAVNGGEDIYRRTLKAIAVSDKAAYNNELLAYGKNSLFWVIKKLLDKLGIL